MDVSATAQTTASAAAAGNSNRTLVNSDFETFLQMLTTQMQNQDPLNPMESTEFATQLATFSGVEQQVRTNDLLTALSDRMAVSSMGDLAGWIGMEARAEMPMSFDGQPLSLIAPDNPQADRMELVVTDAEGQTLQRLQVPEADTPFQWAGVTTDGSPLPNAVYGFHVEYFNDDVPIDTRPAQGYARIDEAQMIDGEVWLSLPGGVQVRASEVQAVRDPG
ncbi:flagellar hook capping FlgD N-terminal domain-containing protein [Nioella nitratireducens]|uniref:flagellar hook capping FlgD N-terminal domain-containing protein n=1 Tax=Nioella nitratireducens TaxID=1287720 RepID=UPI0008FD1A2B|nr:flagellar hook capping FlgD N-terminal domain-containing protein [Nioella nitratireducens]